LHTVLCSFAVWLFNVRGERPMGNAIFRWLVEQARRVGDERSIELQERNVKVAFR
jgi:hypothetical protein